MTTTDAALISYFREYLAEAERCASELGSIPEGGRLGLVVGHAIRRHAGAVAYCLEGGFGEPAAGCVRRLHEVHVVVSLLVKVAAAEDAYEDHAAAAELLVDSIKSGMTWQDREKEYQSVAEALNQPAYPPCFYALDYGWALEAIDRPCRHTFGQKPECRLDFAAIERGVGLDDMRDIYKELSAVGVHESSRAFMGSWQTAPVRMPIPVIIANATQIVREILIVAGEERFERINILDRLDTMGDEMLEMCGATLT